MVLFSRRGKTPCLLQDKIRQTPDGNNYTTSKKNYINHTFMQINKSWLIT